MGRSAPLLASSLVAIVASASPLCAQDPSAFFQENCAPCHTIGGGEQGGPDLKWVTERHERQWLIRFVADPEGMVASGDPQAVDIVKHWDGAVMPSTPDLTPQLAEAILRYIDEKSAAAGAPTAAAAPAPVFTRADFERGRALFAGAAPLTHRAPPCITCHAAADEGGIAGGGRLGVDLTQVSPRLRGPRGVSSWLEAPPTPVMRALIRRAPLTPDENHALTAFFDGIQTRPASNHRRVTERLTAAGAAGALIGFAAVGFIWRSRFRGVRKRLVDQSASLRRGENP